MSDGKSGNAGPACGDDTGGGGKNVPFSSFSYDDDTDGRSADITLYDDAGKQLAAHLNKPEGTTILIKQARVKKVKAVIKEGNTQVVAGEKTAPNSNKRGKTYYFTDATFVVARVGNLDVLTIDGGIKLDADDN